MHWKRWRKAQGPESLRQTSLDRWRLKVAFAGPDECWEWTAGTVHNGYGHFYDGERKVVAHRWAYEHLVGSIPNGMFVLHRCDNPPCVNPAHLWLGTLFDNAQDRVTKGRDAHASQTHCKRGHPLSGDNLVPNRPSRECRTCRNLLTARRHWKRR